MNCAELKGGRYGVKKQERGELVKTTVELPKDLWKAAKIRAIEEGDFRTVLIHALEAYLKKGRAIK